MDDAEVLRCPDCSGSALRALTRAGGISYDCGRCGGEFVEHAPLAELLKPRQPVAGLGVQPHPRPRSSNPLGQKVRYRPCPICRELMNRKNFGGASGVILDVCTRHGAWFDAGELGSVLSFVEQGGLEQARLHAQGRARHEASLERQFGPKPFTPPDTVLVESDATLLSDFGEGVVELIEFVHDVLAEGLSSAGQ